MRKTCIALCVALIGFAAVVTFVLGEERRADLLGALPWALLLLCPLLHLLMQRARGGPGREGVHGGHGDGEPPRGAMAHRGPSGERGDG